VNRSRNAEIAPGSGAVSSIPARKDSLKEESEKKEERESRRYTHSVK
jgi:hypothetical protein